MVVAYLSGLLAVVFAAAAFQLQQSPLQRDSETPKLQETRATEEIPEKLNVPMTPPSCFYKPNPPYTKQARDAKFHGPVELEVVIELDGTLSYVRITKSPGLGLDKGILKTVKTWKCKPATYHGKPARTSIPIEIEFRFRQAPK